MEDPLAVFSPLIQRGEFGTPTSSAILNYSVDMSLGESLVKKS